MEAEIRATATKAVRSRRLRPYEILTAGYLVITGSLGALFGPPGEWWPVILVHLAALAVIIYGLPRLPQNRWSDLIRDWLPVAALPLLYMEVGRLDRLIADDFHDATIAAMDQALFGRPGAALRQILPWSPAVEYLHFSYIAYYILLPLLGGVLYYKGKLREFRYVLTVVLGTFYICYICFIIFPVAGPWYHRPHPTYSHLGDLFFPSIVRGVLDRWASKGAAFPSSHVAVSVVIWLLSWRLARRVFWFLALVVPALAISTVYGGFHYAIDVGAGVVVGVASYLLGPRIVHRLGGYAPGDPEPSAGD